LLIELRKAGMDTEKPVGLILNFGERKVEVKRKIKELDRLGSMQ